MQGQLRHHAAAAGVSAPLSVHLALQIGFLYLRYVLDPRTIWDWLQYYVKDHEVCAGVMFSHDHRCGQMSMIAPRLHGQS